MATNTSAYMAEYMQIYRKENKNTIAKAQRNWQEKNKEHLKNYMKEYRTRKKTEKIAETL